MKKTEIGTLAATLVMAGSALAGDLALPEGYTRQEWAREVGPSQPLTVASYRGNDAQTHLPNGGFTANYKGPWKHDLFHSDHRPYSVKDLDLIGKAARGVVMPWTCASGNAGRAMPDGTWLRCDLKPGSAAFYLQTCNHPADTWGASGDTSVWRAFDAPEKGDYRLSFRYAGRPGMFGATTHVRVWKGVGTKGEKVMERTVRAMSDAAFVQYDAFVGIAEPGRYTVEFFQRQPEEMGARTDKTIVIDSVEFVRDRLFEQVKAERASALPAKYDVAALVYPGYQPDPRWPKELGIFREGIGEWQNIKEAKPKWPGHYQPRRPVWGFENEADPKVMERKIEAASSHGVNVFIYDWYWYYGRPFLEAGLHDGFLGARNNGKMQFFLMWANHNWTEGCNNKVSRRNDRLLWDVGAGLGPEGFRAMARRVIDMYFSRPNYYRICGRPVFMIYEMSTFVRCMGGMEEAAKALRLFREDCEAAGLGGVHLMGCSWGAFRPEHVAALGMESATMYTYAHHVMPKGAYLPWAAKGLAKLDAEKARLRGLKAYFGHATVGWDTNPRYPEVMDTVVNSTPAEFEKALRDVKDWCDRNTPAGYPRLISINAWNEWIEGSYLEPDEKYGMGYLEAIHKVFR